MFFFLGSRKDHLVLVIFLVCEFISSGHEAAFAAFLCCLCKVGALRVDDQLAIVFKIFNR